MKIVSCDVCEGTIPDDRPFVEIMVKDSEDRWFPLDLCSRTCVLDAFGLEDEPVTYEGDEGEEPELEMIEGEKEEPENQALTFTPRVLTPDERMENEKRYKKEAEELSRQMYNVGNRTLGER